MQIANLDTFAMKHVAGTFVQLYCTETDNLKLNHFKTYFSEPENYKTPPPLELNSC